MTSYAQFNVCTVTGRIADAKVVTSGRSPFLSVTVLSTATKNGETLAYSFTDAAGLLALHQKGMLMVGREITITGHIGGIRTTYPGPNGNLKLLRTPELRLLSVTILDGGLGRMPAGARATNDMTVEAADGSPVIDETPAMAR